MAQTRDVLRGVLLTLLMGTVLTGLMLLFVYQVGSPYQSTAQVLAHPFWRFILGLHHWGSAGLILAGGGYLFFLLFTGQFRRPAHWGWYAALALVGLALFFQLTGHALPWDQRAYWTVVIESGIAGDMPVAGPWLMSLIRSGAQVTTTTLEWWYRVHVWILPLCLLGWLVWTSRLGWWQNARSQGAWRNPGLWGLVALWLLGGWFLPIPFGAPADPESSYAVQPEWYVLPLHASLTLAQDLNESLGWLGSGLLPGSLTLLLVALPFLVRSRADATRSPWLVLGTLIGFLGVLVFALTRVENMASPFYEPKESQVAQSNLSELKLDPQKVELGKQLFQKRRCLRCHQLGSQGNQKGPKLTSIGRKRPDIQWHIEHLKNPKKFSRGSTMPSFSYLEPEQLEALAQYLVSLR